MTPAAIQRLRDSFKHVEPRLARLTAVFYQELFRSLPEARPLFKTNLDIQQQHMAAALALIVRNLPMLDAIQAALRELGSHHARIGVRPDHYPPLRDALLFALGDALGNYWTDQLVADWSELLDLIAAQMLAGAKP